MAHGSAANVAAVSCGEVIEPGAKFCVKCGTRIDDEEQKPAEAGDSAEKEEEISTD